MHRILNASDADRRVLFVNTAEKIGMHPSIVEKDFWVCYMLDYLFHRSEWKDAYVFKGGTSLSKAYHVIKRFSEDIDLILDWRLINHSDSETWCDRSNTQQDKFNKKMNDEAAEFIRDRLIPSMIKDISAELNVDISVKADEKEPQTVNFKYPKIFDSSYLRPEICLEIGPLAEWMPCHDKDITSFAAEQYVQIFENPSVTVRTVDVERTFWEKITILHTVANSGKLPLRYARHYYDVYCMSRSDVFESALSKVALLDDVVKFKTKFYYAKSASYETAKIGTLKLVPDTDMTSKIKDDYEKMKDMIYGDIPAFGTIMDRIAEIETIVNENSLVSVGI